VDCARALASRAIFFDKGKIAGEGTVEEIVARFRWDRIALSRPASSRL